MSGTGGFGNTDIQVAAESGFYGPRGPYEEGDVTRYEDSFPESETLYNGFEVCTFGKQLAVVPYRHQTKCLV